MDNPIKKVQLSTEFLNHRLSELLNLYEIVKEQILFCENYNGKQSLVLTTINEVRNSYDHFFRAIAENNQDESLKEFFKAERHLKRAGSDACEIVFLYSLEKISHNLEGFDNETISAVIPKYYTEYSELLHKIQKNLAIIRGETDNNFKVEKPFEQYSIWLKEILAIEKEITENVPAMFEHKRRAGFSFYNKTVITAVLAAVITFFVTFFLTKYI